MRALRQKNQFQSKLIIKKINDGKNFIPKSEIQKPESSKNKFNVRDFDIIDLIVYSRKPTVGQFYLAWFDEKKFRPEWSDFRVRLWPEKLEKSKVMKEIFRGLPVWPNAKKGFLGMTYNWERDIKITNGYEIYQVKREFYKIN